MPGYSAGHELDGNCIVQSRGFDNKQFAAGISPGIAEVEDEDDPFAPLMTWIRNFRISLNRLQLAVVFPSRSTIDQN